MVYVDLGQPGFMMIYGGCIGKRIKGVTNQHGYRKRHFLGERHTVAYSELIVAPSVITI